MFVEGTNIYFYAFDKLGIWVLYIVGLSSHMPG